MGARWGPGPVGRQARAAEGAAAAAPPYAMRAAVLPGAAAGIRAIRATRAGCRRLSACASCTRRERRRILGRSAVAPAGLRRPRRPPGPRPAPCTLAPRTWHRGTAGARTPRLAPTGRPQLPPASPPRPPPALRPQAGTRWRWAPPLRAVGAPPRPRSDTALSWLRPGAASTSIRRACSAWAEASPPLCPAPWQPARCRPAPASCTWWPRACAAACWRRPSTRSSRTALCARAASPSPRHSSTRWSAPSRPRRPSPPSTARTRPLRRTGGRRSMRRQAATAGVRRLPRLLPPSRRRPDGSTGARLGPTGSIAAADTHWRQGSYPPLQQQQPVRRRGASSTLPPAPLRHSSAGCTMWARGARGARWWRRLLLLRPRHPPPPLQSLLGSSTRATHSCTRHACGAWTAVPRAGSGWGHHQRRPSCGRAAIA